MQLQGVSALITGAASGLGAATARALAGRGAAVTIVDLDAERADALAIELGGQSTAVAADVTDPDQAQAAVDDAAGKDRPLRVAVNCAGVGWASRVLSRDGTPHDLDLFARVIGINLIGTFNVLRLAAAQIARTEPLEHGERGVVVNTASIAAYEGQIGQIAYAASKAGVVGLTLPAARDLASVGVRVCTIAPGIIDTPMLAGLTDEVRAALAAGVPFPKRLGTPEDYAALVCMIIEHGYLNGETIRMDAALRMAPK
ncbi:MAG: SDR family NAD(P)-dependent oxidoreductase [Geodermatophilaceae bacterium]|jgi:NAD(P)-dependent dehydrogenase (short-subunit alcohol dehydrogenase family)|nr:SDR family NAD(P)-dependent oxidoreductase [Geodermatophilaceae bacterium]